MIFQFETLVKESFKFLEQKHGFICVESASSLVKFESADVFVDIDFDSSVSYEVSCSVGRLDGFMGSNELPFDLGEIMRSHGIAPKDAHSAFQVTTNESLGKFLKVLAGQLNKLGQKVLAGDPQEFQQLAKQRDEECARYALDSKMRQIRSALEVAWTNKEYGKVLDLLDPVAEHLSEAERKKLHYAKSHL